MFIYTAAVSHTVHQLPEQGKKLCVHTAHHYLTDNPPVFPSDGTSCWFLRVEYKQNQK